MLHLSPDSTILVYCPSKVKTGGTELLHQLAHELMKKYRCYMVYTGSGTSNDQKPKEFNRYQTESLHHIPAKWDLPQNVVIVPETQTGYLAKYEHMQKVIWWLSVDNYLIRKNEIRRAQPFPWRLKGNCFTFGIGQNRITHLVQSHYAWLYLRKHGVRNIQCLSDYINDLYMDKTDNCCERKDVVLFNPKKGKKFTQKIMEYDDTISYVPIIGMDNQQIVELMERSKVYIDFGEHPGKDRLPREAAMKGLCIITGKKGAAGNEIDVRIPAEFKFPDQYSQIPGIVKKIRQCLNDYENEVQKMNGYVSVIKKEKRIFQNQINQIFYGG